MRHNYTVHFFSTLHTLRYWNSRVVPLLKEFNKDFSELITFDDGLVMSIGQEEYHLPKRLLKDICEEFSISYIKYSSTGRVVSSYFTPEDEPKSEQPELFIFEDDENFISREEFDLLDIV